MWALALALCLLAGCGDQAAEPLPEPSREETEPPAEAAAERPEPPRAAEEPREEEPPLPEGLYRLPEPELRPYEDWTFQPEPYLVTVEEYGE